MDITIIQTCDAIFYHSMLTETAKTVRRYCMQNGFVYEQYIGVKRGRMPWQSTYNRIYMLKELLDRKVGGWVLYMDADAMIVDQSFDLRAYFSERSQYAGIFSGFVFGELDYAINAGGFAINLSHPLGRALVLDYWRMAESITDEAFDGAIRWTDDIYEDQYMLHLVLQDYVEAQGQRGALLFERHEQSYVNEGPFISQLLRCNYSSFAERLAAVTARVAELMADAPPLMDEGDAGIYLAASHPRVLTLCGIKRLSALCSTGVGGTLLWGPYVDLAPGQWAARIYGEVRLPNAAARPVLTSDVVAAGGDKRLAERTITFGRPEKGLLIEHRLSLPEGATGLELRLLIEDDADVLLHAVQFVRI